MANKRRPTMNALISGIRVNLANEGCADAVPEKERATSATTMCPVPVTTYQITSDEQHHYQQHGFSELVRILGKGPMQFAPINERTVEMQIEALSDENRSCFETIKAQWELATEKNSGNVFSDAWYLRFARHSRFNSSKALARMQGFDARYASLRCIDLEEQLLTRTLFIPPGLRTIEGYDVLYMRPSRYFPKETKTEVIIDNLVYCMQVMLEEEYASTNGIAFMADMADWKRENFDIFYCKTFMAALQGYTTPVNVRLFLIVDPPRWFGVIWDVMKTFMTQDFASRVRMISSEALPDYLDEHCFNCLPDDAVGGRSRTKNMVSDFVTYRKYVEGDAEKDRGVVASIGKRFSTVLENLR